MTGSTVDGSRGPGVPAAMALGALPLAWLAVAWALDGLGADPVSRLMRRSGDVALGFLVLSLVPGTLRRLTGDTSLLRARRVFGLLAFGYAGLHLLGYVGLAYGWRLDLVAQGVAQDRFVLAGLATFLILAPLAATSTRGWQRRLGPRWSRLHRLAYAAAMLDIWHFAISFKEWRVAPLIAGALVVALLLVRLRRPA